MFLHGIQLYSGSWFPYWIQISLSKIAYNGCCPLPSIVMFLSCMVLNKKELHCMHLLKSVFKIPEKHQWKSCFSSSVAAPLLATLPKQQLLHNNFWKIMITNYWTLKWGWGGGGGHPKWTLWVIRKKLIFHSVSRWILYYTFKRSTTFSKFFSDWNTSVCILVFFC